MRQWWVLGLVAALAVVTWVTFLVQVVGGEPVGNHPASDVVVAVIAVGVGLGVPVLVIGMRLVTEVAHDGVVVRFVPFRTRRFAWQDVQAPRAVTYRPVREFGGWGIRRGRGRRTAFSMSGDAGVEWDLRDGSHFLVGSLHPEALLHAIESSRTSSTD